jgi:hypothetical protein
MDFGLVRGGPPPPTFWLLVANKISGKLSHNGPGPETAESESAGARVSSCVPPWDKGAQTHRFSP